jgi:hypothetical protein
MGESRGGKVRRWTDVPLQPNHIDTYLALTKDNIRQGWMHSLPTTAAAGVSTCILFWSYNKCFHAPSLSQKKEQTTILIPVYNVKCVRLA